MQLWIGEHLAEIRCRSDSLRLALETQFLAPPQEERLNRRPDLRIKVEQGSGLSFAGYDVAISVEGNRHRFHRADYRIVTDGGYSTASITVNDELALKHALMNLYSAYIVHHRWGIMLHSSCVVDQGKAHIFAGVSGAGKSTVAKLSQPRELFSDEATLIRIGAKDAVQVFNSPFRSEWLLRGQQRCGPLASIQLLHQAQMNKRTRLSPGNGLLQLLDKVFYWAYRPEETGSLLKMLHVLAGAVPTYELHFQNNDTFWELIS